MGTRSLTVFIDERGHEICVLYKQFDGYPGGWGLGLKDFFKGKSLKNGIDSAESVRRKVKKEAFVFNGIEEIPVWLCRYFLEDSGFYFHSSGTRNCGEDFIYKIYSNNGKDIMMDITTSNGMFLYKGSAEDF